MNFQQYDDYTIKTVINLFGIDSTSGFTTDVTDYILNLVNKLGSPAYRNYLGNVIVTVEGID